MHMPIHALSLMDVTPGSRGEQDDAEVKTFGASPDDGHASRARRIIACLIAPLAENSGRSVIKPPVGKPERRSSSTRLGVYTYQERSLASGRTSEAR